MRKDFPRRLTTMRFYDEPIREWQWVVAKGKVETFFELPFVEYRYSGLMSRYGSETFTKDRMYSLRRYEIWTWDGKTRNSVGWRRFEKAWTVSVEKKDRHDLPSYLSRIFPKAEVIQIRKVG